MRWWLGPRMSTPAIMCALLCYKSILWTFIITYFVNITITTAAARQRASPAAGCCRSPHLNLNESGPLTCWRDPDRSQCSVQQSTDQGSMAGHRARQQLPFVQRCQYRGGHRGGAFECQLQPSPCCKPPTPPDTLSLLPAHTAGDAARARGRGWHHK